MLASRIRAQLPAKNIAASRLDVICFAKGQIAQTPPPVPCVDRFENGNKPPPDHGCSNVCIFR